MDWLKQALVDMLKWIGDLFKSVFVALWDIFKDIFSWIFDQLLDVVISAISAIDVSALEKVVGWGDLPSEIINILGLLNIGAASGIILSAIGIRLVLQLVPFTRLGS